MTDKVQLIKEEILRRKQSWQHSDKQYEHGGKDVCDYLLGFIDSLPEEPASEDLEEEFYRFVDEEEGIPKMCNTRECIAWGVDIASHFAEWQEKKMLGIAEAFYQQGRYEQEQEMMKDAVEGEVVYQIGSAEIAPTDIKYKVVSDRVYIPNVKLGDKVKIIIVKEEQ